ncbi:Gentisate 1,2-dioxygenase [Fusarium oxysporum f. sp. albedinis]|nr:Gentisate 1,2-dioxygenase [Fusarium oxysporum f. sp. albedinis]
MHVKTITPHTRAIPVSTRHFYQVFGWLDFNDAGSLWARKERQLRGCHRTHPSEGRWIIQTSPSGTLDLLLKWGILMPVVEFISV